MVGKQNAKHLQIAVLGLVLALPGVLVAGRTVQDPTPAMPAERGGVYVASDNGQLVSIPFETGRTPLKATEVAKGDKTSYVEVTGEHSQTLITDMDPRIYVFVPDQPGAHPPFLVALTGKKGARRVTALTERGRSGYAIAAEEIVKPHYRVLAKEGGLVFMEIHPRSPLMAGEYAIMGSDLSRVATFSVGSASKR